MRKFEWIRHFGLAGAAVLLGAVPLRALAVPAVVIPSTAPATMTQAGTAESFMSRNFDTHGGALAAEPAPSLTPPMSQLVEQDFKYKVWQDAATATLKFHFEITDYSMSSGPSPLKTGDKLVIQFDGDNSGESQLQSGDMRYELSLNPAAVSNQIDQKLRSRLTATSWNVGTSVAYATVSTLGNKYTLDLAIPESEVGIPTTQATFGLAIGWANDTGYAQTTSVSYLSGTSLPADLQMTDLSQPGFSGAPVNGDWANPSKWAKAYLGAAPANPTDIRFSHSPYFYFSEDIRLGICNTLSFNQIQAPDPNAPATQNNLQNWYLYNPDGPCKMSLWFRPNNFGLATQARFLVLWGDAGLGMNAWRTVALTPPVAMNPGQATFVEFWGNVPVGGSGAGSATHPCVKVYVLPLVNPPGWTDAKLLGMTTAMDHESFESAYGKAPNPNVDFSSAQMNFTNLGTGTCTAGVCDLAMMRRAQSAARGDATDTGNDGPRKATNVNIFVTGFGVSAAPTTSPYTFIEEIGGIGWSIPGQMIATGRPVNLDFVVGNPRVASRNFDVTPPVETLSPPRRLFLATKVNAPAGTPMPKVTFSLPQKDNWAPGEVATAHGEVSESSKQAVCGTISKLVTARGSDGETHDLSQGVMWAGLLGVGGFALSRRRGRKDDKPEDRS